MAIYQPFPFKQAVKVATGGYAGYRGMQSSTQLRNNQSRGSYVQKRRKQPVRNSFKQQMMKTLSAKHDCFGPTATLVHNTIYSVNVTEQITQGTSNEGRIGDSIYLEAVKLRGIYTSDSVANAYNCRVIVGFTGEEVVTGTNFSAAALASGELFLPGAPSNLTALINPKTFTCLYDEIFDVNSQISSTRDVSSIIATIPLKQTFLYQSSGSVQGKTKNLHIVVISNVYGGTSGVTSTGEIVLAVDTIFK